MIGKKILELRKKNNLSQEKLAESIGVSRQTISNWELGETSPDLKQAGELSKILNISLDELVGNENILLEKVTNTEINSNIIIKLIKISGITLGLVLFFVLAIVVFAILFKNYYTAEPTATGIVSTCYYNNEIITINVMKDLQNQKLTIEPSNYDFAKKFDTSKYNDENKLLIDIIEYIESNDGVCSKKY